MYTTMSKYNTVFVFKIRDLLCPQINKKFLYNLLITIHQVSQARDSSPMDKFEE